ncbi:hypothetical protein BKA70DRAFT_1521319 [Coprinopsis sp. MPI-PUGE-AT-0042]|nr:hypothetical protein BKA70DRAFT_1521319 [Coprinopsis sp. MPI-PUGE-AT-0042]
MGYGKEEREAQALDQRLAVLPVPGGATGVWESLHDGKREVFAPLHQQNSSSGEAKEATPRYSPDLWKHSVVFNSAKEMGLSFACTAALSLLGDAFLVWRLVIIWSPNCILKFIPVVLYIIYFGICIASSTLRFRALSDLIEETKAYMTRRDEPRWKVFHLETIDHTQLVYQIWCGIEFAMSVVVSATTTTLICIRLILLERKMKRVAARSSAFKSVVPYRQVLALLIESALPFTLVGVAGAIMAVFLNPSSNASTKAMYAFPFVTVLWTNGLALGPQFIIFRIVSGTAWSSIPTTRCSRPISQPILFADDPVVSLITTYDDEDRDESGVAELPKPEDGVLGLRPRHGSEKSSDIAV